jgi:hypothetical protein
MHAVPAREEEAEALRGILSLLHGHGIEASAAAACCGTRQRRSGAQQPDGTARPAIGGLQRGDTTGRHEAALAGRSCHGFGRNRAGGGNQPGQRNGMCLSITGAVAGWVRSGFPPAKM